MTNCAPRGLLAAVDRHLADRGLNLPVEITVNEGGGTSQWVAVAIALAVAAMIGLLAHLLVFRPLRAAPALSKVIGAVGLTIYLQAVALLNYGSGSRAPEGFVPEGADSTTSLVWRQHAAAEPVPRRLGGAHGRRRVGAAQVQSLRIGDPGGRREREGRRRCWDIHRSGWPDSTGCSPRCWPASSAFSSSGAARSTTTGYTVLVVPALGAALLGGLTSIPLAVAGGLALGMFQAGMVELTQRSWWPGVLPPPGVRETIPLLVIGGYLYLKGAGLPVRGTVTERRLPRAPEPRNVPPRRAGASRPRLGALVGVHHGWEVALTSSILAALLMLSWVVITGYLGQISLVQLSLAGVAAYTAARLSANVEKVSELGRLQRHRSEPARPARRPPRCCRRRWPRGADRTAGGTHPRRPTRGRDPRRVGADRSAAVAQRRHLRRAVESDYPVPRPEWFGAYVGAADPDTARTDYWRFTLFAVIVTAAVAVAVAGLRRGPTGRRFLAVRANERAAAAAGINVARTKLTGFAIAAGIAGLAGVLQSYRLGSIRTDSYGLFIGLALFAFVYLGGITSVYGAVIGGLLVSGGLIAHTIDTHADGGFEQYVPIVGAIGLIVTAIVHPEGIALANAQMGKRLWNRVRGVHCDPARGDAVDARLRTRGRPLMTALLETRDLTVTFGGLRANDDVDIVIEPGSFVGLIGPNGAGKTTFIDAITGYVSSTGEVFFDGERISGRSPTSEPAGDWCARSSRSNCSRTSPSRTTSSWRGETRWYTPCSTWCMCTVRRPTPAATWTGRWRRSGCPMSVIISRRIWPMGNESSSGSPGH